MDDTSAIASIILFRHIREFSLEGIVEETLQQGLTRSQLREFVKRSAHRLPFLARFPKPLLQKLLNEQLIPAQLLSQYSAVFNRFGIESKVFAEVTAPSSTRDKKRSDDCFKVWVKTWHYDESKKNKYEELLKSFDENFKVVKSNHANVLYLPSIQFPKFLDVYIDEAEIHWFDIYRSSNTPWTNELLIRHQERLDWSWIHRNPSVGWNFELIEVVKDRLNWSYISCCPQLNWTPELLDKYKEYLVFKHEKPNHDGNKRKGFGRSARGVASAILDMKNENPERNPYGNLSGIISDSSHLDWSIELIEAVKEYWDWRVLSANEHIPWTDEWIELYVELLDFKALSTNKSVSWNQELVERYSDKWNWEALTQNPSLPWSEPFIAKFEGHWKWTWRNEPVDKNKPLSFLDLERSISDNTGITWTYSMLRRWETQVDVWTIAGCGNLTDEAIVYAGDSLDEARLVGWKKHKFSDWRETEDLFDTGWERLGRNQQVNITLKNVEYYYSRKTSISYCVGNAMRGLNSQVEEVRVLGLLKGLPVRDLTYEKVVENEFGWSMYLLNPSFVNDTVWSTVVREFFTPEFIGTYLSFLHQHIDVLTTPTDTDES